MQHFFTSDTHFFHAKMAERRGFASVEAMNDRMVDDWNRVVGTNDTVYHLGDLSFAGAARTISVIERLKGKIKIVPGNHDDASTLRRLAAWVEVLPPLQDVKIGLNKMDGTNDVLRFTLCHFPMLVWNRAHYGAMHLHGHSHGFARYPHPKARIMDVGVDATQPALKHWGPINLEQVLAIMAGRAYVQVDQHEEG